MRTITKVPATREDLAIGVGIVQQQRGSSVITGSQLELNWIMRSVSEIRSLDITLYTRVQLHQSGATAKYWYDATSSAADDGINVLLPDSNPALGRWVLVTSDLSAYLPLTGTASGAPITGEIIFTDPVRGSWSLNQGDFFGSNGFLLNSLDNDGFFAVSTKDGFGNDNSFSMAGDGKLTQTGVLNVGDLDTMLTPKLYVDTQIAAIGGSPANAVLITGDQSIAGVKTFTGSTTVVESLTVVDNIAVGTFTTVGSMLATGAFGILVESSILESQIALNTIQVNSGDGLSGGGDLTTNRTFAVDGTVVRTTGIQSIAGLKTFTDPTTAVQSLAVTNNIAVSTFATVGSVLTTGALGILVESSVFESQIALNTIDMAAGDGLSGGGDLTANRSFAVDGTVLRTTGAQSATGVKTFTSGAKFGTTLTDPNATNTAVFENTIAIENPPTSAGTVLISNFGVVGLQSSDIRYKTNIRPSTKGLETVLAIEPIQFGRDPELYEIYEDTGFSAQQLQGPLPEAAPLNKKTGDYGYRDTPVVSALVLSVHQLHARLEAAGI